MTRQNHSCTLDGEPPIYFLLSSPRAGSTLVSRMLNSHSRIAAPCEICVPYVVLGSWKLPSSIRKMWTICRYYQAPFPMSPIGLLWKGRAKKHFFALARAILRREGKSRLVVKDPRHAAHFERIEKLLGPPGPKYVLLDRDARGVAHSFARTLGRSFERGFRAWSQATSAMLRVRRTLPQSRLLELKFESLLADPAESMTRLVEFLGCDFEPEMFNYGRSQHADDAMGLWRNPRLVSTIKAGALQPGVCRGWQRDEELLRAYEARPDVKALNRRVGYDLPQSAELSDAA